ncbi:hypothetical protein BDF20DRAFT_877740 [Mycotypha africana]|uniref:uncharacterized protein n=1 Tax=Mycotypha africana TaxID=64632 RepID=UPI0023001C3B|nr:uncharacterized protein BDF20DRAFT_877740 [Mycotypha africana]KAI8975278.1 hypothetical protein BDF20DRAFT_877740 [Mycotypha africana]
MVSSTAPELTSAKPFNKKQLHRSVSVRSTLSEVIFVSRSSSVKSTNNDTLTSDASITDQHNLSLPDGDISGNQQQSINKHSNFHATNTRQDAKDDDQSIDHFITTFDSHPLQAYDVARTLANPFHDTQTSFRTANEDWSKNP